jgi:hypothetical protein
MDNPLDLGQAEKLKNAGNVHMQNKAMLHRGTQTVSRWRVFARIL